MTKSNFNIGKFIIRRYKNYYFVFTGEYIDTVGKGYFLNGDRVISNDDGSIILLACTDGGQMQVSSEPITVIDTRRRAKMAEIHYDGEVYLQQGNSGNTAVISDNYFLFVNKVRFLL